jgi:hypothetical protein
VAASLSHASLRTTTPAVRHGSSDSRPIFSPSLCPPPAMTTSLPVMPCHLFQIATPWSRFRRRQTARRQGMTSHERLRIVTRPVPGARIVARIGKVHILLQTLRWNSAGLACEVQSHSAFPPKPPLRTARTESGQGPVTTGEGQGRPTEGTGARRLSGTGGIQSNRFPGARFGKNIGCRGGELNGNCPFRRRVSAAADERHLKLQVAATA